MSETAHIADQLKRAFEGGAWHGPALLEILTEVDAPMASVRPVKNAHTIWEIARHIGVWDDVARRSMAGEAVEPTPEQDWPPVTDNSEAAWHLTLDHLRQTHNQLLRAVSAFSASRLNEQVPGKTQSYYTFYYLLHGVAQHELYHAGQIALLKKASS